MNLARSAKFKTRPSDYEKDYSSQEARLAQKQLSSEIQSAIESLGIRYVGFSRPEKGKTEEGGGCLDSCSFFSNTPYYVESALYVCKVTIENGDKVMDKNCVLRQPPSQVSVTVPTDAFVNSNKVKLGARTFAGMSTDQLNEISAQGRGDSAPLN